MSIVQEPCKFCYLTADFVKSYFFFLLSNHYIFLVKTTGERILSECLKSNLAEVFEICLFIIIKKKECLNVDTNFFLKQGGGGGWGVETIKIDKNIEVVICCTAFYKKVSKKLQLT